MADETEWEALRAEISVNEDLVGAYGRLIEVGQRLYALLERRGLTGEELDSTFEAMQAAGRAAERESEVYLSTLAGYVSALGGTLEVRAVFDEETIILGHAP